ncbi:MAG: hypothetical protein JXQ90_03905 [Cyclobacteriaceae bacterium]
MKIKDFKFMAIYLMLMCISLGYASAQEKGLDNIYTSWAEKQVPVAYENISNMVERVWGADDAKKNAYLVEMHCQSLNKVLVLMEKEDANWDLLGKALEKWTQSEETARKSNWWEWPDTNWMKVEYEYRKLLANPPAADPNN